MFIFQEPRKIRQREQQISDIETARKLEKKYRVVPENKQFHLDNLKIPKSIKVSYIAIPQQ